MRARKHTYTDGASSSISIEDDRFAEKRLDRFAENSTEVRNECLLEKSSRKRHRGLLE